MSQTADVFKEESPGDGNISLLRNGSNEIVGMTVSTVDCNGNNIQTTLATAETLLVGALGIDEIVITAIEDKDSWYYFEVEPISYTGNAIDACSLALFLPFENALNFKNTDYNILFNNIEGNRTSDFIYDVDREKNAIVPTNINSILSSNALPAAFQDSNYSSLANSTGRYIGSKTDITSYGIEAALSGTTFYGASYSLTTSPQYICSQSNADKVLEEFIFAPGPFIQGSSNSETPALRLVPLDRDNANWGNFFDPLLGPLYTVLEFTGSREKYINNVIPGDTLILGSFTDATGFRAVEVTSITHSSDTTTTIEFDHLSTYANATSPVFTTKMPVGKLVGDGIYKSVNNKLYKVTSKYIWIRDLDTVYLIDKYGNLFEETLTCEVVALYLS